ncbi:MAG TPA: DUF998 domain-containing protein [Patescibacteria group bacterium]|nr:DUF998 domain-containing protein [Patescibacteria group bacterium]
MSSTRVSNLAGIIAPVVFITLFTIEGWLRLGYSPMNMFVSELSLGSWGWVQIVNFLITGSLIFIFGRGVAKQFPTGKAAKVGSTYLQIIGLSLIASGPFVTDPSVMFNQTSIHGIIHGIFGAVVFLLMPVTCFVFFRSFQRDPLWRVFAWWTLAIGVLLVIGIGFLKVSQFPQSSLFEWKGLIQRIIIISYLAWIFAFAVQLIKLGHLGKLRAV